MDNYRPISLLPSISKLFEKVVSNQVSEYFKKNNLFHDGQYGFRDHHSTELANIELSDRIISALDKKQIPVTIYMDLLKAFDALDHDTLLKKTKLLWHFRYSSRMVSKPSVTQKSICGTKWRFVIANKNHDRCPTRFYPRALIVFDLHERHSTIKPVVQIYTICRRHEPVYHFRIFFTDFNIKHQRTTKHRAKGNKWLAFSK